MREHRLQLRAEDEHPVIEQRVMERLHAQPVAGEEERFAIAIPEREGEHSAEAPDAVGAPRLPRVDDHFGVALRPEHVAQRLQLGHELEIVVDLAVVDDDDRVVLVVERLLAGRQVDDRQPPVTQSHPGSRWTSPSSGPRWNCESFIRTSSPRSMSRRDRVSKMPVIPHMIRSSSAAACRTGRM
jgi:hypothetical protein